MKGPSSNAKAPIEAVEVRNGQVEDGIFWWWTRSVEGHKPLVRSRAVVVGFITTQVAEGIFRETEGGGKRSHRKPNTMVIRGESASGLPVPSAVERRSDPSPSRAFYPPVARHWKFIELPSPLSTSPHPLPQSPSFSLSHPSMLSWLDRRQAFRYLNNPPIRLSLGVGMISRIYSPSTYEE